MTKYAYAMVGLGFLILIGGVVYITYQPLITLPLPVPVSEPSVFSVPEGFSVSIYADGVSGARVLTRDQNGTLVLSQTSAGKVVALPDTDQDNRADSIVPILDGLNGPHGVQFIGDDLYVAEEDALWRYPYDAKTYSVGDGERLLELPEGGGHATRSLWPHPDGRTLLVAVGSSCNVCDETEEYRATVVAYDLVSGESRIFARGLRNTVFMTTHPVTGEVWGTEMGRDLLGDDIPPDEVNILREGGNYGWPICYGQNIHDTNFDKKTYIRNPCMTPFETPARIDLQAHSAPLGIVFIPEEGWPEEYWHDALIAYHGSWNRSVPTGYKVVRFDSSSGYRSQSVDFMTGFMTESGEVLGRPVGVLAEPGGTMYLTDDKAGAVYRVSLINQVE